MLKQVVRQAVVDLRSDTVTRPCEQMRRLISQAKVGDDVMQEDPTVKQLEKVAAQKLGKDKALFVPSGTMGNLISLAVQTSARRTQEIIVGDKSHLFLYEGAGASAYLGLGFHTLPTQPNGELQLTDLQHAFRADDPHYPRTGLVALENTHNTCGGKPLSMEYVRSVSAFCKAHQIPLHVDGARLANTAVALNLPLATLVEDVDSVTMCLSKGLGAPVGSVVAGSDEFIHQARRVRKSLGGGLRQAGILASAGLFALENNLEKLRDDHLNAKHLAKGLEELPAISIDASDVFTNIVYFKLKTDCSLSPDSFIAKMKEKGVLIGGGYGRENKIRAVMHLDISPSDVDYAIHSAKEILSGSY